jgi:F0F1-type ATP synthase membrane subunit b/b'
MKLYYIILVIIVTLALINLATLAWVVWLQKLLREKEKMTASIGRQLKVSKLAMGPKWDEMLAQVEQSARQAALDSVEEVSAVFNRDLATTSLKVNQQLEEQASTLIQSELTEYQETFADLRQTTTKIVSQFQDTIEQERQQLLARLADDAQDQKAEIVAKFEARMAEVIAAYLTEVLGNEVDLGAQSQYLFRMLEQHKAELKQEILGEA